MYIIACRAHFCHLLGLGEVGHSQGKPMGVMGPWTGALAWPWWGRSLPRGTSGSAGAQCGQAPSPLATPMHPWHPYTPDSPMPQNGSPTPLWAPNSPFCHLYPFWPLSTYTPSQPLIHPLHPQTPLMAPTPPRSPNAPLCHHYTPSGPWVPTLPASTQYTLTPPIPPDAL